MNGKLLFANDYESMRPHHILKVNFIFGKRWFIELKYNQYYLDSDVTRIMNFQSNHLIYSIYYNISFEMTHQMNCPAMNSMCHFRILRTLS